jgi:hypothetical protein
VRLFLCLLLSCLAVAGAARPTLAQTNTEAPRWCEFAKQYLRQRDGKAFDCVNASRCIKLNNYGCSQNHSATPYPGQLKTPQGSPVTDPQKHVLYEHPKWSIHKTIGTLLRYQTEGKRSALAIAETYAPWCDTRGSKRMNGKWGRTCADRLPSVPPAFKGPRCTKVSEPADEQCKHCNCPNRMARFYLRELAGIGIDDPIQLFDASRKPAPAMHKFLTQVFIYETGYVPSASLVAEAIGSFSP